MTSPVVAVLAENEGITLREFAWHMAHYCQTAQSIRECGANEKWPEVVRPKEEHNEEIKAARERILAYYRMPDEEAEQHAQETFERENGLFIERHNKQQSAIGRYSEMLHQVQDWEPAYANLFDLKAMLLKTLRSSLEPSPVLPKKLYGREYIESRIEHELRLIETCAREDELNRMRVREANEWLFALRMEFGEQPDPR